MEQLGIDPTIIIVQVVNFFILYIVLKKYLYKPVVNYLKDRADIVKQNQKLTLTLENGKKELEIKEEKTIKDAKLSADEIVKSARSDSSLMQREIEKKANLEAKRILKRASEKADMRQKAKQKELKKLIQTAVAEVNEEVLPKMLTSEQKAKLTEESVKRFLQM